MGEQRRRVYVDDVIGAAEVAEELGLAQPSSVRVYRLRGLPALKRLRGGWLYSRQEVREWRAAHPGEVSTD